MKDSEKIKITENDLPLDSNRENDHPKVQWEKLKKPLIYFLMAVVCAFCFYLIFRPKSDHTIVEEAGLNTVIPEAKDGQLQSDKQKAYEQQLLEQRNEEKRNAITSLSDYWNDQSFLNTNSNLSNSTSNTNALQQSDHNAYNNYRNAQQTLSSFYGRDDTEVNNLRKEVLRLKNETVQNNVVPPGLSMNDQLELMEKSYQIAAKYLPTDINPPVAVPAKDVVQVSKVSSEKEHFVSFTSVKKNAVSSLDREPTDSAFLADWSQTKNRGFYTAGVSQQVTARKNSIKACVQEQQTVVGEVGVRLRLLEAAQTPNHTIPKGTIVTANAKYQGGRLQLKITTVELDGNIIPVEINIYDLDGQQGLYVPYSAEMNALTEMAGNMSQQSGTSLMLTQSAGQQVAADLSRGVVQGISGYFAKKVRTPKVTLKAGHQVFLVSKQ